MFSANSKSAGLAIVRADGFEAEAPGVTPAIGGGVLRLGLLITLSGISRRLAFIPKGPVPPPAYVGKAELKVA